MLVQRLPFALVVTACAAAPTSATSAPPESSQAILRRQTQALLDAVTAGDRAVWDRYLDPQVVYLSEAGEVQTKAALLDELHPMPPGISGNLAISRFDAVVHGDTAVVVHVDDESESYFGHQLHAQYLSTATWRRGPDGWKLISQQVLASPIDPPAIAAPADVADYLGSYQLTDQISYAIRRDGDQLVGERTGRKPQPLRVEARDVWFVPGQPRSRKVFQRDAAGRITGFADRREGRDIVWTRAAK
jgi:ketosteroid isomerase-like protein